MSTKTPREAGDLLDQLAEQIGFLKSSADAFDSGNESEAKRLAVTLRTLLHDRGNTSKSLLGQLGMKGVDFLQSAKPHRDGSAFSYHGLIGTQVGPDSGGYFAVLDDANSTSRVPFDQWWEMVIFRDKAGRTLTRKDLVLVVANQDGGAHVDEELDERYASISRGNSLSWHVVTPAGSTPMKGPELAALRQIAHEVLKVLVPNYAKKSTLGSAQFQLMDLAMVVGNEEVRKSMEAEGIYQPVARNAPCPCGSGKKYKRCHGKLS